MTQPDQSASPLETVAEVAGTEASDAFSDVSNETRLAILLALWDEFDPFREDNSVPFTELRERVGVTDSGQFNYHLDTLVERLVRKTDDGYELRRAGLQFVRTVIAGAGLDGSTLDETRLDMDCPHCGGPVAVVYRNQWFYAVCTDCDGGFDDRADLPDGTLSGTAFPPAGLANRSPEETYHAAWAPGTQAFQAALEGVCDVCSGPIEQSLHLCEDHADRGLCTACGRQHAIMARFRCPVCKAFHAAPPKRIVAEHPAVVAFYYERGVSLQYEVDDFERSRRRERLVDDHDQELASTDPIRIRVTIRHEGDELRLTLDEEMSVLSANESG